MEQKWPSSRSGHVSVSIGKYLLIWGGYSEPQNVEEGPDIYLPPKDVWLWDSENYKWVCETTSGDHPSGLSGSQAVYLPSERAIYIMCGFTNGSHRNEVYRLDVTNWSWTFIDFGDKSEKPSPRDKFSAWEFKNRIYIFGGYGPHFNGYLHNAGSYFEDYSSLVPLKGWNNQLLIFDPQTNAWSNPQCTGCVPSPRAAHSVACVKHTAFLFGGRHNDLRLNDLYSLDLQTLQWTKLEVSGDLPAGRSWHTFTPVSDGQICLFGGYTTNRETLGDLWCFDTTSVQWRQMCWKQNCPRLWHTASSTSDEDVFVFGGCSNDILSNEELAKHAAELLVIRLSPTSLLRLCLDAVLKYKDLLEASWSDLPQTLSSVLQVRSTANDRLLKIL